MFHKLVHSWFCEALGSYSSSPASFGHLVSTRWNIFHKRVLNLTPCWNFFNCMVISQSILCTLLQNILTFQTNFIIQQFLNLLDTSSLGFSYLQAYVYLWSVQMFLKGKSTVEGTKFTIYWEGYYLMTIMLKHSILGQLAWICSLFSFPIRNS